MRRVVPVLTALAVIVAFSAVPLLAQPKDEVVFDAKMGKVTFQHKAHVDRKVECKTCHHKDDAGKEQACRTCHKETDTAGGAPAIKLAVHGKDQKSGLCITCHSKPENEKAPKKCTECHKKG